MVMMIILTLIMIRMLIMVIVIIMISDVLRSFGRPVYHFGHTISGAQKALFKFSFFSCISTKIYFNKHWFHNASNYFEMAWNTKMQTEEKNIETLRWRQKKKLSKKVFSFIWLSNRAHKYLLFLLCK